MNSSSCPDPAVRTTAAWRLAGERGDGEAARRCLSEKVEVTSPLTAQFRSHGLSQPAGREATERVTGLIERAVTDTS